MFDRKPPKSAPLAPSAVPAGTPRAATPAGAPPAANSKSQPGQQTGRVVHDERGNAVWDWLKETSRIAIESTSRLLKKLETPELKVEDSKDEELRLMPDGKSCPGGGYDPYNQSTKPPTVNRPKGK